MGLDGIVLTNHYHKGYVKDGDDAAFARDYVAEYRLARAYGDSVGFSVLFGLEITMDRHHDTHLLVYGVDEAFVEAHPPLYDLTQEELYSLVHGAGGLVIQAHPYRGSNRPLDPAFLDGYEINCHPLYRTSRYDDVVALACEQGKLLTCGGDFHADTYRPHCGVYLPPTVTDPITLVAALRSEEPRTMLLHEPADGLLYRVTHSPREALCRKEALPTSHHE